MRETEQRAREAYVERFGGEPEVVAGAPGRINRIGEHTDYNGGFVLPCAIDRRIAVAAGRNVGETLYSADFDEARPLRGEDDSWAKYPRGVLWALREGGHDAGGFGAALAGDVPRASGLSSSAAIEAATALALDALFGLGLDKKTLARICQRAENEYVGVGSGIMDQYASLLCEAGAALLVDCRSLDAESVPLDLEAAGLALVVCDNARVLEAVGTLRDWDFEAFGRLMYASHTSLRNDYEVSTPELDTFVRAAEQHGARGARLTGAGFGGCAIALVPEDETSALTNACERTFAERGFEEPAFYEFVPAAGAELAD